MIYIVLSTHFIKRLTKKVDKTPKSQVKFLLSLVEPSTKQIEVENAENQRLFVFVGPRSQISNFLEEDIIALTPP